MIRKVLAGILIVLAVGGASYAAPVSFDVENPWDYNVFAFGDVDVKWSDSEGKVAGEGNVTVNSYRVGAVSDPSLHSLTGGEDVSYTGGEIHNGGIFAGRNAAIDGATVHGEVAYNGTLDVTNATIHGGTRDNAGACPVDFDAVYNSTSLYSSELSLRDATSDVVDKWGNLHFTGTEDVNYFELSAAELSSANGITFDFDDDETAIINVSGESASMSDFQTFGKYQAENILFNFFEARDLSVSGIGVKGSVLAADAQVAFDGGHIDGNMIAGSIEGYGEFHSHLFRQPPPRDVPEPTSLAFLSMGALLLGAFARKKKLR
ncbi:MAG: choice-of-anchor A family protein [Chitinispirillaceae bacterium]